MSINVKIPASISMTLQHVTRDYLVAMFLMQERLAKEKNPKTKKKNLSKLRAYASQCMASYKVMLSQCKTRDDYMKLYAALCRRTDVNSCEWRSA